MSDRTLFRSALGILHQHVGIDGFIECFFLNAAAEGAGIRKCTHRLTCNHLRAQIRARPVRDPSKGNTSAVRGHPPAFLQAIHLSHLIFALLYHLSTVFAST